MNYNPFDNTPNDNSNHENSNFQNQNSQNNYSYRYQPPRQTANPYETIAMVLGIASLVMCSCLYISIPVGAMAIILALLSRGKKMELGSKAKLAIILGIIGVVATIIFYAFAFYVAIQEYGSLEALLREACEMSGYDYDALFGDMLK